MNLVDLAIVLFLIIGAVLGFRSGAVKTLTSFIGLAVVAVVAFMFKNQLSAILYENLPFFDFFGDVRGIQVINIVFYEVMSFLVLFILLLAMLHIVLVVTGLFELVLKMTVILSIPSKIIGIIVGVLEYYIYAFIILFVVTLPVFHLDIVNESKYGSMILRETPILSDYAYKSVGIYNEIYNIVDNRDKKSEKELNKEILEVMLKNKFITYESAKNLADSNKVELDDIEFMEKYK